MLRITYGEGGYDSTKPNGNIVKEEWLPDLKLEEVDNEFE